MMGFLVLRQILHFHRHGMLFCSLIGIVNPVQVLNHILYTMDYMVKNSARDH